MSKKKKRPFGGGKRLRKALGRKAAAARWKHHKAKQEMKCDEHVADIVQTDDDNDNPRGEHNVTSFPAGHSPPRGSACRNCEIHDSKLQTSRLHLADEKSAMRACSTSVEICEHRLCEEGLSPLKKKRALGPSHWPTLGLEEGAINFIESLKEARKSNNEYLNYGLTVADRLAKIESARRLSVLKHKIDTLIHEAMMEEITHK